MSRDHFVPKFWHFSCFKILIQDETLLSARVDGFIDRFSRLLTMFTPEFHDQYFNLRLEEVEPDLKNIWQDRFYLPSTNFLIGTVIDSEKAAEANYKVEDNVQFLTRSQVHQRLKLALEGHRYLDLDAFSSQASPPPHMYNASGSFAYLNHSNFNLKFWLGLCRVKFPERTETLYNTLISFSYSIRSGLILIDFFYSVLFCLPIFGP